MEKITVERAIKKTLFFSLSLALITSLGMPLASAEEKNSELVLEEELHSFDTGLSIDEMESNRKENNRLMQERKQMRSKISQFEQQNKSLSKRLEDNRKALAKTQQLHYEETGVLQDSKVKHSDLKRANSEADAQLAQAQSMLQVQRDQIAAVKRDIQVEMNVKAQLAQEKTQLAQEKSMLNQEKIQLAREKKQLERELQRQRNQLRQMRQANQRLEDQNYALRQGVDELRRQSGEAGEKIGLLSR